MISISYPSAKPRVKKEGGQEFIYCLIRKRWLLLTPEEWVRQNFMLYLTAVLSYPVSLIAVEKQIQLGEVKRRFDIVLYDQSMKPYMVVECKEMNVRLTEDVLRQALHYNSMLRAPVLVVTNGNETVGYQFNEDGYRAMESIPDFGT